jgi:fibronectin-binding autotransporter adhesin
MQPVSRNRSMRALAAASAAALACFATSANAQTWDGNGNAGLGGSWTTANNWNPDTVPNAVGAAVVIPANTTGTRNISLEYDGSFTVGSFSFPSAGATAPTTIGATDETATLVFDNGGNGVSISLTGSSAPTFTAANYINFRAPIILNEQLTANVDPRGNGGIALNFPGNTQNISGVGGITKNGLGILAVSDTPKTYTGPTIVNAGRFRIQPAVANIGGLIGTSSVTVNAGGQLQFDTGTPAAGTNNFGPNGNTVVTLNGIGVTTPGAALTAFQGAIRVETNRVTSMNNKVVLASDSLINTVGPVGTTTSLTISNVVSGPGGLIHNGGNGAGNGTLILNGVNTYSGGTTANAGTLTVTDASGLGAATSPLTVNSSAGTTTVNLSTTADTTIGSLNGANSANAFSSINNGGRLLTINQTTAGTFPGTITGAGGLVFGASSSAVLTLAGANNYTGPTTINASRLQTTKANALPGYNTPGKVTVNSGATLGVTVGGPPFTNGDPSNWTAAQIDTLHTNATFAANTGLAIDTTPGNFTYGFSLTKPTTVSKLGTNTLTLSAANTHTGGTSVAAGTLVAGHPQALGTGQLSVANAATAQIQPGLSTALTVSSVSTTGTGKLDITNNAAVIKNSTLATVTAQIVAGYNNGDFFGSGITSSTAANDPNFLTAVGYAANIDAAYVTFEGVGGLDDGDVLVKYTYYGDADLTGSVDLDDFNLFLAGYQDPANVPQTWIYGDFDYTGSVDLDDFNLFLAAYQANGAPLSTLANGIEMSSLSAGDQQMMLGAIAAVPEPGTLGVLALAAGGLLARRRRNA